MKILKEIRLPTFGERKGDDYNMQVDEWFGIYTLKIFITESREGNWIFESAQENWEKEDAWIIIKKKFSTDTHKYQEWTER